MCKLNYIFVYIDIGGVSQNADFHFTSQNSSRILRESLCRTLSGVGELENYLRYPSNVPKYTTSDPHWVKNNLSFDIPF